MSILGTIKELFERLTPDGDPTYRSRNWLQKLLKGNWDWFESPSEGTFASGIVSDLTKEGLDFSNLSQSELESILTKYWEEDSGLLSTKHTFDKDRFISDYNAILAAMDAMPEAPDEETFWIKAQERANAEAQDSLNELEDALQSRVSGFNDELQNLADSYRTARSGILSQQYQQNAQLADTLSSQLDKQSRNALEAGASAGIRLASNVNTLLSVQNKQSQASLDTANQLAEMMVRQRNAESSIRSNYDDYMSNYLYEKRGIKDSAYSKAKDYYNQEYGIAENSYDKQLQKWDESNDKNPLWDTKLGKSKYNKTGD